jgi:hypothetical protein
MKTFGLGKLVLLGVLLCSFVSCQEEEFYNKEYIEGAIEEYERNTVEEDDLLEQINDEDAGGEIADNGGNNGGDDGGSTGSNGGDGGTTGSNGSNGGSGSVTLKSVANNFTQQGDQAPIDILWVVDNSGSMADEQQALADNFNAFIQDFVTKDIDFQMAITTTDRNRKGDQPLNSELQVMNKLTKQAMENNPAKFVNDFKSSIQVGITGYGIEKGLKSSELFTDVYANQFIRENAYLIIVYVSDERDQSNKTVPEHLAAIASHKTNQGLIKTYSIVDMDNQVSQGYILKGYERYKEMSELTGGYIANLYDNFAQVLGNMGVAIANLADQFPLSERPDTEDSIEVRVNGVITVEWDYDSVANTIKFQPTAIPTDGSTITVTYDAEE